jgi:hypothetical protein
MPCMFPYAVQNMVMVGVVKVLAGACKALTTGRAETCQ